jgi:sterol 3beta-glucosyltransferase
MEYAKSLIKSRNGKLSDDNIDDTEESWTFIGDENDPELVKRIQDWEGMAQSGTLTRKNDIFSESEASGSKTGTEHMIESAST